MNPIFFSFGPLEIKWYSILIIIGILISYYLIIREAKKFNINSDFIFNLLFWTVIFGFIGARLYYVIFNFHLYRNNFIDVIKIWEGGLAIHGAIIFGLIVIYFYSKKYKLYTTRILDIVSVPLILAQAIGRWGNFFNSEAYGSVTSYEYLKSLPIPQFVIDGMNIGGIYYTPTFFYESMWCLLGFLILIIVRRFRYIKVGQTTSLYLIWYGIGRFFIEASRTDSLMFFGFKVAQIVSIILIIIGFIIFAIKLKKSKFEDLYNDKNNMNNLRF